MVKQILFSVTRENKRKRMRKQPKTIGVSGPYNYGGRNLPSDMIGSIGKKLRNRRWLSRSSWGPFYI